MTTTQFCKTVALALAGLLLFSCEKTPDPELSLSSKVANFDATGTAAQTINITTNQEWTASCPEAWVSVSPASGTGDGSIKITVQANTAFAERTAQVTVKGGELTAEVTVTQLGASPSLSLLPMSFEALISCDGATIPIEVTSNAPWTVNVAPGCDWITVSPESGEGAGTVQLTIAPNTQVREVRQSSVTFKETVGNKEVSLEISQEMCPPSRVTDSLALVNIYNASHPDNWPKEEKRWDLTKPMNEWAGVALTDGRVTSLKFTSTTTGNLTEEWSMPEDLCDLTELTEFRVVKCALVGDVLPLVYQLPKLQILYLTNNKVTSTLTAEIGNLTDLTDIYIDQNEGLGGTIPAAIGQLTKLKNLNISKTAIGGTIPAELAQCAALTNLMAFSTQLASPIPEIWDKFTSLGVVQLYGNPGLEGPLPTSMGNITTSSKSLSLHLYNCNFTGNIPESYANLPAVCKQLRIQDNRLSGQVPDAVMAHVNWTTWAPDKYILPQQSGYGLYLPSPRQLDSLALVNIFNASHPDKWPKEEKRWDLTKPMNEWAGVSLTDGRVTSLRFLSTTTGNLTEEWTMPEDLCDLTELKEFRVVKCALVGDVLPLVYQLPKLQILYLTNNKVTSTLTADIGKLTELTDIYIDQNPDLGGTIPATIGKLTKLKNLNISKTNIGGTIPAELADCAALSNLMAFSTQMVGPIPEIWDKFTSLGVIQLYGNPGFDCPLPTSMGNIRTTQTNLSLHLYNCNFTGSIPESYANLPAVCKQLRIHDNKLSGTIPAAVKEHVNWTTWNPDKYIYPQQEGYGFQTE